MNMKQIELNTDLLIRKLVATIHADEDRLNAMRLFSRTAQNSFDQENTRLEKGLSTDLDFVDGTSRNEFTDLLAEPPATGALVVLTCAPGTSAAVDALEGETWKLAPLAPDAFRHLLPTRLAGDLADTYHLNSVVLEYEGDHEKVATAVRNSMAFHHNFNPRSRAIMPAVI